MVNREKKYSVFIIVISIIFFASAYVMFQQFFGLGISSYTVEILAAVLGSTVTVTAMIAMLRIQRRQETEKEYSSKLFEKKLIIYERLLTLIFEMDDDNIISKEETDAVENQIGVTALVASSTLVALLSQFAYQLKVYGVIYKRSMKSDQRRHFADFVRDEISGDRENCFLAKEKTGNINEPITYFVTLDEIVQGMREDLSVVEGAVQDRLEYFVALSYNQYGLVRNPSIVDSPKSD